MAGLQNWGTVPEPQDTPFKIQVKTLNAINELTDQESLGDNVNVASVGGTAVATNAGNADAGTQRVVIATDQPALPISIAGGATEAKQDVQITAEQAIQASVEILDDWDESDRAKVNPVVGQAGVQAGAGAVSANTQRVVIATDQTAVPVSAASLPLPSGAATAANQATQITAEQAIQTSVEILDDWDESDRAKVNPIVGQAGIQGGAGSVSANTTRIAIATDANAITAVGTVADDGTTPGAPVMIGGTAKETDGTDPGSVSAENDVTRLITDRNRILFVNTTHPFNWSASENHATAQTNNSLKGAPGSGLSLYITDIIVSNGATAGSIRFVEDTGGTPVIRIQETYLGINGGASLNFKTPIRITADKDFGFTSTTVTTHSITVCGYTAP